MQPTFIRSELAASLAKRETDSETLLAAWAKGKGLNIRRASKHEDMREHIDFHLSANGATITVDVKGSKEGQNAGLFLIELKNVQGNAGWLYGRADYILFQEGDSFLVVDRQRLADKLDGVKEWKKGAKGCLVPYYYCRHDRPSEMVTFLKRAEILECKEEF